jgi:hypothetical protein
MRIILFVLFVFVGLSLGIANGQVALNYPGVFMMPSDLVLKAYTGSVKEDYSPSKGEYYWLFFSSSGMYGASLGTHVDEIKHAMDLYLKDYRNKFKECRSIFKKSNQEDIVLWKSDLDACFFDQGASGWTNSGRMMHVIAIQPHTWIDTGKAKHMNHLQNLVTGDVPGTVKRDLSFFEFKLVFEFSDDEAPIHVVLSPADVKTLKKGLES